MVAYSVWVWQVSRFSGTKEETAPFNKITISVDALHGLRIREAIPSPDARVLCKLEGR